VLSLHAVRFQRRRPLRALKAHRAPFSENNMSEYQIRPAVPRDALVIADIYAQAISIVYAEILSEEALKGLVAQRRQGFWREAIELGEPQMLVVVNEADDVVGFGGFDRSRDDKTPATMGEIWHIYVSPAHWDQGAGLALWDGLRDGLDEEGCTHASLWLALRNERALRFHEIAGFKREMKTARTVDVAGTKVESIRLSRALH